MKTLTTLLFLVLTATGCDLEPAPPIIPSNTTEVSPETPYEPVQPIIDPITPPEELEPEPEQRGDLLVSIYADTYKVGDTLDCSARVQSSRIEDILIQEGNIELRLMKYGEIKNSDGVPGLEIVFKEQGFIELEYSGDKVRATTSNTEIIYDGVKYIIPSPLVISFTRDANPHIFKEIGTYHLEVLTRYLYEGEEYDVIFKGEDFLVE